MRKECHTVGPHGDADIGGCERGGVVDAIAHVHHLAEPPAVLLHLKHRIHSYPLATGLSAIGQGRISQEDHCISTALSEDSQRQLRRAWPSSLITDSCVRWPVKRCVAGLQREGPCWRKFLRDWRAVKGAAEEKLHLGQLVLGEQGSVHTFRGDVRRLRHRRGCASVVARQHRHLQERHPTDLDFHLWPTRLKTRGLCVTLGWQHLRGLYGPTLRLALCSARHASLASARGASAMAITPTTTPPAATQLIVAPAREITHVSLTIAHSLLTDVLPDWWSCADL